MGAAVIPPWVVLSAPSPNAMLCERCGASQAVTLPILVDAFAEQCEAFGALHESCIIGSAPALSPEGNPGGGITSPKAPGEADSRAITSHQED